MSLMDSTEYGLQRWNDLASRVLDGKTCSREDATAVLEAGDVEIPALLAATFRIRHHYFGRKVQLYFLQNAKSGLCPEDCGYCSQSKISEAAIPKYVMSDEATLMAGAQRAFESKAKTYCIVASGRGPTQRELQHVASTVRKIKEAYPLHICACLGLLEPEDARVLKDAGVDRINHNLNTSETYHEEIVTTHTYADRVATLKAARDVGLELCSGGIIGMGEQNSDVVEMALSLREFQVESIPVNFLHPIDGTPLAGKQELSPLDCLRALCMFRFTNPQTELRIAGGRELHLKSLQSQALYAANSLFVSDYLTTTGQPPQEDVSMIEDLGFEIVLAGGEIAVESCETAVTAD